ncbi:porin [Marivivens donghaensis]|uniref:porin n=1 Tax=Marivivens donghaensis TaxID=1699413 RepID=UPI00201F3B25|nr:porin [Marivivens donghaensis]MCL7409483.1 porin [Marivivens donghaensis]MDN3702962.1 porin [Marivivens donghaensis]
MKKILLASVALTAFAGAAAAEVSFGGDAKLGYNDNKVLENGFYWEAGLTAKLSQDLDNGLTVAATLDIDLVDAADTALSQASTSSSDWVLTISNADGSLAFGDVATAASTFAFTGDMDGSINDHTEDYDMDTTNTGTQAAEGGLLAKYTYGDFSIAASTIVGTGGTGAVGGSGMDGATQVAAAGSFGGINVGILSVSKEAAGALATNSAAVVDATLVSIGGSLAGVDVVVNAGEVNNVDRSGISLSYAMGDYTLGAYAADLGGTTETISQVSVAYASGPLSAKAYYTDNRGGVKNADEWSVAVGYDMGNGLVLNAGIIDGSDAVAGRGTDDDQYNYFVADYSLGGGASFLVSYADANNDAALNSSDIDTTLGGYELKAGTTVQLKFAF